MSRTTKRRIRLKSQTTEISILNLIDVIFILLIFFMIATTFDIYKQIEIKVPEVSNGSEENVSTTYDIIVDKNKNYFIKVNNEILELSKDELLFEIRKINENTNVTLSADSEIEYKLIMEIISELKNANISTVNLTVRDIEK